MQDDVQMEMTSETTNDTKGQSNTAQHDVPKTEEVKEKKYLVTVYMTGGWEETLRLNEEQCEEFFAAKNDFYTYNFDGGIRHIRYTAIEIIHERETHL